MRIIFVRHSKTLGNEQRKYIGTTDEDLSAEGVNLLQRLKEKNAYPPCDLCIVSPMKRCKQTKEILYPDTVEFTCEDLRECDFGDFENKNYDQLKDNADYQKWLDSVGTLPFPNGESHEDFTSRCKVGFLKMYTLLKNDNVESACFVVHGGTVMSIMEAFSDDKKTFYDYQLKNGEGYITEVDDSRDTINIKIIQKVTI